MKRTFLMTNPDPNHTLTHYTKLLAEALGVEPSQILFQAPSTGEVFKAPPPDGPNNHTTYDDIPDPYAWMEHHLREAAYHITLVQLYREYGHAGNDVVLNANLQKEVLDQAVQLVGFISEQWDDVWSYSQAYYEMVAEVESEEAEETTDQGDGLEGWSHGGMDWPGEDE
jgi:hypothetical protein